MPFIPHTPESLLPRSDSKNPATTCKGITATGRSCRRPLRTSSHSSPTPTRRCKNGVVAVLEPSDEDREGAAAFFCWQHQDQADTLTCADQNGRKVNIVSLQQRTSIDTLVDRLGVLEVGEDGSTPRNKYRRHHIRPARKETLPQKWRDMDGPLLTVLGEKQGRHHNEQNQHQSSGQSGLIFSLLCCVEPAGTDGATPPRARRPEGKLARKYNETAKVPSTLQQSTRPKPHANQRPALATTVSESGSPLRIRNSRPVEPVATMGRPLFPRDSPSQTEDLLSLIPKSLSPQAASILLAELAKPVSLHDEEGYIYMFWLTDAAIRAPASGAASSLLADAAPSMPKSRCESDILQEHTAGPRTDGNSSKNKTLLLKIGRASNVQRRMNEWARQCGYNLSLIRFYPYLPTSPSHPSTPTALASPSSPQRVPHAHRVERLIHLELAEQRVKQNCESCGKQHREWFEVESSREGLRNVDEVIRRWVVWGQRAGSR